MPTLKMELFVEKAQKPSTIFAKSYILDVFHGPEFVSDTNTLFLM